MGHVKLTGTGDTIRQALSHADGTAGLVARSGTVRRVVAAILGQDLGHAIGAALGGGQPTVPLRCLVVGFEAHGGLLVARDFIVATGISRGRGQGTIKLGDETMDLTLSGDTGERRLKIVDPIHIGGTLSAPDLTVADLPTKNGVGVGGALKVLGKSLGNALGLGGKQEDGNVPVPPVAPDCDAATRRVMG